MKLASIEKIISLEPIPGADAIEKATILGYEVVVKKGQFKANDLIIFHYPDTIVDGENPVYAFLKGHNRLRIIKLRGQISQGLALPISDFPAIPANVIEGDDVSELVKAVKYEKVIPLSMQGKMRGNFPSWLKMTDEESIRSNPAVMEEFRGNLAVATIKIDGSSSNFALKDGDFHVCSRRVDLLETEENVWWKMARKYKIKEALINYGGNYSVCGETFGAGLNGNALGLKDQGFAAFNLWNIDTHSYCDYGQFVDFCDKYGIPRVKEVWKGIFNFTLEELIKFNNELKYDNGTPSEGTVWKGVVETHSEVLKGRLSAKIINENYKD